MSSIKVPQFDEMFNPLLQAIKLLGGSATNAEIEEKVAEIMALTEDQLNEVYKRNKTKFSYRVAWAKHYLKNYGLLENSERGVWSLTILSMTRQQVEVIEMGR